MHITVNIQTPCLMNWEYQKLADINKYISSVFMYKHENNYLPKCFVGTFTKNQEVHHYNGRFAHHSRTIKCKSDKMKYSIKVKGPKLWKEIPQKIRALYH